MATKTQTQATDTENGATPATGADARAARLAAKRGKAAQTPTPPRTVNAVPKPGAKRAKAMPESDTAELRRQEAEGKRLAKEAADAAKAEARAKAEAEKAEKAAARAAAKEAADAAKAERKAAADAKKAEREAAAAARRAANAPTIDFKLDDCPVEETTVMVERLINLPEMVGANPDTAMVRSVKDHGVVDPVTLFRRDEDDTDLRVGGGRRRIKASELAGRAEVPARVFTVGDKKDDILSAMTVQLNSLRSENFAADVQAIEYYRTRYPDMSLEKIAREIGVPFGTVKKRARLLGLRPELRELLYSGALKPSIVVELAGLEIDQQDELIRVFRESGKLTYKDVLSVRNPNQAHVRGSGGGESENVNIDALLDGPQAVPTVPDTGDLTSDLLGFLEAVAESSGIAFNVDDTGMVTFTRGDQVVGFQASAGTAS